MITKIPKIHYIMRKIVSKDTKENFCFPKLVDLFWIDKPFENRFVNHFELLIKKGRVFRKVTTVLEVHCKLFESSTVQVSNFWSKTSKIQADIWIMCLFYSIPTFLGPRTKNLRSRIWDYAMVPQKELWWYQVWKFWYATFFRNKSLVDKE